MLRTFATAMVGLVFLVGPAYAGHKGTSVTGKLKGVNIDKSTITVTVDGTDKEFKVSDKTKFLGSDKKELEGGLKSDAFKTGVDVTIKTGFTGMGLFHQSTHAFPLKELPLEGRHWGTASKAVREVRVGGKASSGL